MLFDRGESIVLIIRKHWLVYILRLCILALAGVLPLFLATLSPPDFRTQIMSYESSDEVLTAAFLLWLLFLWISAFVLWTNYYLDIWIVTDKSIIDVNQRALFNRDITTLRLEKIQDVTIDVAGPLATLFSFGTLTIHTAGDHEDIVIRHALNPAKAKEKIMSVHAHSLEKPLAARDWV